MKNRTILVAEDEDMNFHYLQAVLELSGRVIVRARNGSEAITLCKTNKEIELVLMDIGMPLIDGLQATKEIRQFAAKLPIVAQTAFALPEEETKLLEAGCNAVINKPIRRDALLQLVESFLG